MESFGSRVLFQRRFSRTHILLLEGRKRQIEFEHVETQGIRDAKDVKAKFDLHCISFLTNNLKAVLTHCQASQGISNQVEENSTKIRISLHHVGLREYPVPPKGHGF